MTNYHRMYRLAIRPWERYPRAAQTSIEALLDREEALRSHPLGRALDLGCGMLAFRPTRLWSSFGAASQQDVEQAFPAWQLLAVDSADTAGLGWPLNTTRPTWYRLAFGSS